MISETVFEMFSKHPYGGGGGGRILLLSPNRVKHCYGPANPIHFEENQSIQLLNDPFHLGIVRKIMFSYMAKTHENNVFLANLVDFS